MKSMVYWCWLLLTITSSSWAAPSNTVLIMGDSLSAAYGLKPEQGWVALLDARLRTRNPAWSTLNVSISGETTAGGLARMAPALRRAKPKVVIIELGANDGLRGLELTQSKANLKSMIKQSQAAGARVLLVGMRIPPNYGAEYGTQFFDMYGQLARSEKVALIPFFFAPIALDRSWFLPDGLHPAARAQPLLLDTVWQQLEPLLR